MSEIKLHNICKRYGDKSIIEDLNLTVEDGSFTVLLGPSGCGKSTTLRMVAGLEQPSDGKILIGGDDMADIEPGKRGIAMVFQNYALYPTMTVRKNIEYGLKNNHIPKTEREQLIEEVIELVDLKEHIDKKPQFLSGGERQRVALARAMVKKPRVFLMDEPLSNLDAKLRSQIRNDLIELHQRLQTTFLYVTHDQVEAMSMGTKIVLMNSGKIMQEDTPHGIYHHPSNVFTSKFIGSPPMSFIEICDLADVNINLPENTLTIGVRPENVKIDITGNYDKDTVINSVCRLKGQIISFELLGAEILFSILLASGNKVTVKQYVEASDERFNPDSLRERTKDSEVNLFINPKHFHFFDSNGALIKA
ncbi:MAG: ABC transporter ATP-binding protein, partial [Spirochaetales bacterium]|nr:ABC transporter ATP-binding protein [Spirochaetales bacterium]